MLVSESQSLELQEISLFQQTVDIEAQSMSRQFAIQGVHSPQKECTKFSSIPN